MQRGANKTHRYYYGGSTSEKSQLVCRQAHGNGGVAGMKYFIQYKRKREKWFTWIADVSSKDDTTKTAIFYNKICSDYKHRVVDEKGKVVWP